MAEVDREQCTALLEEVKALLRLHPEDIEALQVLHMQQDLAFSCYSNKPLQDIRRASRWYQLVSERSSETSCRCYWSLQVAALQQWRPHNHSQCQGRSLVL